MRCSRCTCSARLPVPPMPRARSRPWHVVRASRCSVHGSARSIGAKCRMRSRRAASRTSTRPRMRSKLSRSSPRTGATSSSCSKSLHRNPSRRRPITKRRSACASMPPMPIARCSRGWSARACLPPSRFRCRAPKRRKRSRKRSSRRDASAIRCASCTTRRHSPAPVRQPCPRATAASCATVACFRARTASCSKACCTAGASPIAACSCSAIRSLRAVARSRSPCTPTPCSGP